MTEAAVCTHTTYTTIITPPQAITTTSTSLPTYAHTTSTHLESRSPRTRGDNTSRALRLSRPSVLDDRPMTSRASRMGTASPSVSHASTSSLAGFPLSPRGAITSRGLSRTTSRWGGGVSVLPVCARGLGKLMYRDAVHQPMHGV